jgi:hypothetical protein
MYPVLNNHFNKIFQQVKDVLLLHANILQLERDGKKVSVDEVYARLKLHVTACFMDECKNWTFRHYNKQLIDETLSSND